MPDARHGVIVQRQLAADGRNLRRNKRLHTGHFIFCTISLAIQLCLQSEDTTSRINDEDDLPETEDMATWSCSRVVTWVSAAALATPGEAVLLRSPSGRHRNSRIL